MANASDDDSDDKDEREHHKKDKPKRTDNDILLGNRRDIIKIDRLGDLIDTKRRQIIDMAANVTDRLRKDELFEVTRIVTGRENSLTGKHILHFDSNESIAVGITLILDDSTEIKVRCQRESWYIILEDGTIADGDTSNIRIDNASEDEDIVDIEIGTLGSLRILGDNEGSILTTSSDTFGDINSVIDGMMLVRLQGAARILNSNPFNEVGVGAEIVRGSSVVAKSTERLDGNNIGEWLSGIIRASHGNTTSVSAASLKRIALTHRENSKKFFFHVYILYQKQKKNKMVSFSCT